MIPTPYYQVGSGIYFNKFQAYLESQRSGQSLHFNLFDQAFDQADWREPAESWDQLLDMRAQQIASLGRPIVLSFSGGTDSYTMFRVFQRNGIKLRALHTKIKKDARYEPNTQGVLDFFHKELGEIDCDIFVSDDDPALLDSWYDSSEWTTRKICRHQFSIISESQPLEHNHWVGGALNDDYIQINGLEKPRIRFINGVAYSYQQDTPFFMRLGDPRYISFYVTPDLPKLHIKQSYMLARYLLALAEKYNVTPESIQDIETLQRLNYLNYAMIGCGRFAGDLASSHQQKYLNRTGTLFIPNGDISQTRVTGRARYMLEEGIRNGSRFATNYLQGLLALRSDQLMTTIFRDSENYYSVRDFDSKAYALDLSGQPS